MLWFVLSSTAWHIFILLLAGMNDSLKLIFTCEWQASVSLLEASGGGVSICL